MKYLKKTRRPLILTINGKAEVVVQDAQAYQGLSWTSPPKPIPLRAYARHSKM